MWGDVGRYGEELRHLGRSPVASLGVRGRGRGRGRPRGAVTSLCEEALALVEEDDGVGELGLPEDGLDRGGGGGAGAARAR